jgi:regulator of protease activity HflC (stomatin/prohibitin superfamily)
MWQVIFIVIVAAIVYGLSGIRVANEYERSVIFLLGRYNGLRGPGLYWIAPGFMWQRKVDMRTSTVDVERQETITKDSVTVNVNAVVWYRVTQADKAIMEVKNYGSAVYQVALTSLRNIIGQHMLDEVLKERDKINDALRLMVDAATEPWGVRIEMVEMKDVEIPPQMQRAMAQEAQAIREKRARLVKAEGEFDAAQKMSAAADTMSRNPISLELRRMQMITEVGAEQNTTTIIMMPSDFVNAAKAFADSISGS